MTLYVVIYVPRFMGSQVCYWLLINEANCSKLGFYPADSARYVLIPVCSHTASIQNDIYRPLRGVSSPVVNFPALIDSLLCAVVWAVRGQSIFWRMGFGLVASTLDTAVGGEYVSLSFRGSMFATGLRLMKQVAHKWMSVHRDTLFCLFHTN